MKKLTIKEMQNIKGGTEVKRDFYGVKFLLNNSKEIDPKGNDLEE